MSSLVSSQNRVESPFIIVKIGDYTFGHCTRSGQSGQFGVTYPNYMESLNVTKINGAVNTYTIKMVYAITQYDDPNMLEKVFSSVSESRLIKISYGDWNMPNFVFREEEAIITKVTSNVDFQNSRINYTITCTSSSLSLKAGNFSFPYRKAKPSDVLKELLSNKIYGLTDIFYGMKNATQTAFNNLIASNDKVAEIQAKPNINVLDYVDYLVNCMTSVNEPANAVIKSYVYRWAVYDDISNEMGGPYFKVICLDKNVKYNLSYNTYEIDIGYPSGNFVTSFNINNNEAWSILYKYSEKIKQPQYSYSINDQGIMETTYSPAVTNSSKYFGTTEASKTWWSQVTSYPITAQITIKGLMRPALLMSYLKVNTYFYGHKHLSSGLYIINKQEDIIDSSGYRTNLTLTRLSGDEME